jgi:hypothetical protein
MEYPKNGSVIIIDDKYDEVSELIKVLNKNKVPTLYFNGDINDLPDDGFGNIRLLFLDINLDGDSYQGTNKPQIIGKLMQILKTIVNSNNGQFILIIWSTMSSTYFEDIQNEIINDKAKDTPFLNNHPSLILEVNKTEVSNITLIQEKINEVLNDNDSFLKYYILFENMIHESTKEVLNDLDLISTDDKNILKVLSFFSDSKSLDQADKNPTNLLSEAFSNISHMLHEKIESKTKNITRYNDYSQEEIVNYADSLESDPNEKDIAILNTLYHIVKKESNILESGNVYLYQNFLKKCCTTTGCDIKWAEKLNEKIFDRSQKSFIKIKQKFFEEKFNELAPQVKSTTSKEDFINESIENYKKDDIIDIFVEVSPTCDVAQSKWKKLRLIFAILIPNEIKYELKGDNFYNCNNLLIDYEGKSYNLILDLHTVTGINFDVFSDINTIFKFKQELIVDIQQRIANHISRPGFFNMNDYLTK